MRLLFIDLRTNETLQFPSRAESTQQAYFVLKQSL